MSFVSASLASFLRHKRLFIKQLTSLTYYQAAVRNKAWLGFVLRKVPVLVTPPLIASRAWLGLGWGSTEEETKMADSKPEEIKKLITSIDALFANNENQKIYDQLKPLAGDKSDEILWRLARSTYSLAQVAPSNQQKETYQEAFGYAKEALELNDQHFAIHKWYAILLDIVGGYEGTKKRIENAYTVKEHFQKAHELNPEDATALHTLGFWHFLFADLPWYQRKIAAVIFASPPTATYEEALDYFLQAEEKEPGFYSMNLLMIGKTYTRMSKKQEAIEYLKKVLEKKILTADDQKAFEESKELLKGHGIKT